MDRWHLEVVVERPSGIDRERINKELFEMRSVIAQWLVDRGYSGHGIEFFQTVDIEKP